MSLSMGVELLGALAIGHLAHLHVLSLESGFPGRFRETSSAILVGEKTSHDETHPGLWSYEIKALPEEGQ